ncbi:MAG TPA: hypothetical protein VFZ25_01450 [Chloroflexota bacterium]|nr:hypothetical protein [Chloroflexota bacterium]
MKLMKRTGLAVVLALALSVSVGAAAASASYFTTGQYWSTLKGEPSAVRLQKPGGREFVCWGGALASEANLGEPTEALTPKFGASPVNCEDAGTALEVETKLAMNGCQFTFHPGAETSPGKFGGTADLGPVGCGPMTVNGSRCVRKFASQSGLPVVFRNEGTGNKSSVTVEMAVTLNYKAEGTLTTCGYSEQQMYWVGTWNLKAYNEVGEQVSTSVIEHPPIGVFLAGKESEEAEKQPRIEGEKYPASVKGDQKASEKYKLTLPGGRTLTCEGASLAGSLSSVTAQLGLVPSYQNCTFEILGNVDPATVAVKSCQFTLNVKNAGPPYAGSLDVGCSKEGDAIELKAFAVGGEALLCTWKIAPQSGLSGVNLENVGSGLSRGIGIKFGISNVAVTRVSGTLTNCGAANQVATYGGAGTLLGMQ